MAVHTFDPALALSLLRLSSWAYREPKGSPATMPTPFQGAQTVAHARGGKTAFGAVARLRHRGEGGEQEYAVIAFRGTEQTVPDWLQNLRVAHRAHPAGGRVHEGFWNELQAVLDPLLRAAGTTGLPLLLTGHSQGGAMAAIAACSLPHPDIRTGPVVATYTFEAPRPGDRRLADACPTPVFRLEFGNDPVPHVPPAGDRLMDALTARLPKVVKDVVAGLGGMFAKLVPGAKPEPEGGRSAAEGTLLECLARLRSDIEYVSLGRLHYTSWSPRTALTSWPSDDDDLFLGRAEGLIQPLGAVADQHSMKHMYRYLRRLLGMPDPTDDELREIK